MKAISEFSVTLSQELLDELHGISAELEIPLEWLVASLICDTVESFATGGRRRRRIYS